MAHHPPSDSWRRWGTSSSSIRWTTRLVFSGGTADRFFRAHNASTGELVWEQRLNSGITGVPTSFAVNGKQYIAVQSGWGIDAAGMQRRLDALQGRTTIVPQGGVLWVFALDD